VSKYFSWVNMYSYSTPPGWKKSFKFELVSDWK